VGSSREDIGRALEASVAPRRQCVEVTAGDEGTCSAVRCSTGFGVLGVAATTRSPDVKSCQENRGRNSLRENVNQRQAALILGLTIQFPASRQGHPRKQIPQ
jgi:hypothetical protein